MEALDEAHLKAIVVDVCRIDTRGARPPGGLMYKRIREEGRFVESGLVITEADLVYSQLFSSVGVLARDMHRNLEVNPRDGADLFKRMVRYVHDADALRYGEGAFPNYVGLPDESAPPLVDLSPASGHIDVSPLDDAELIREWHLKPGMRLILNLCAQTEVHDAVCCEGGPRDLADKVNDVVLAATATSVAAAIVTAAFTTAAFWYPLAAYCAVYLAKHGLNRYCGN